MSSTGFIVVGVVIALFLANAGLAYRYRSRQMLNRGERPPSFLKFLFFPRPFSNQVSVPGPIRLILGAIIVLGGVFFLLISILLGTGGPTPTHPIAAYFVLGLFALFGVMFLYVGICLIAITNHRQHLFPWRDGDDAA